MRSQRRVYDIGPSPYMIAAQVPMPGEYGQVIQVQVGEAHVMGNTFIPANQTYYLSRSNKFPAVGYVVMLNTEANCFECFCGGYAERRSHDHITQVKLFLLEGMDATRVIDAQSPALPSPIVIDSKGIDDAAAEQL